ncbi:hypothetical protein [Thermodesulfovibrio thiophilus]|nr:hypothetical protein [Thermodesulfovibrio thiophilus]HHW19610.1 hypothetical protein [Thermodesulfovibrio thiophilus]
MCKIEEMNKEGVSCIVQTTVKKKRGYTHERDVLAYKISNTIIQWKLYWQ